MWPLLWKGIVVFAALAFLSSVFRHRPPKSLDSALLLYYCCCCCCFLLKRAFIFSVLRKMVQPSGWMSTASSRALCVCVFNTPVKHRNSDFSGFQVPPFFFKTQPGIFSEPWPDRLSHRYPGQHSHRLTLAGSSVWSLQKIPELPCPFLQALSSGASKTQRCEGKTPARGVLHVIWSQKWEQMPTSAFSRASSVFLE